jgi:hypothetical protein
MACAECGGNFVIAANSRYGCASHWTRGSHVCSNKMTVSRHIVEDRILRSIKSQLLEPGNAEKFKQATTSIIEKRNASGKAEQLAQQLKSAERVRENILAAIKQGKALCPFRPLPPLPAGRPVFRATRTIPLPFSPMADRISATWASREDRELLSKSSICLRNRTRSVVFILPRLIVAGRAMIRDPFVVNNSES